MCKSVLLISHEMSRTGAPIMLLQASRALINEGFKVHVLAYKDGHLKEEFQKLGIQVVIDGNIYETSELLLAYAKEHDLVIINTIVCSGAVKTFLNQEIPVLWWIHEGTAFIPAIKGTIPDVLSKNFHLYCVSEYTRKLLGTLDASYSSNILYNGIDGPKEITNTPKSKRVKRFMCVGTIEKRKGQDLILKAIELLVEKGINDMEFVFVGSVGDSEIKKQIDDFAKQYEFVKFYPIMPREKVMAMLAESTALLVPSRDDPSPLVASEAMMLGIPVIVSNKTGTADLIENGVNGFVIETENYIELFQKILWLREHTKEADAIGKKGRKIYEQYYAMEKFSESYVSIVNSILNISKIDLWKRRIRKKLSGIIGNK